MQSRAVPHLRQCDPRLGDWIDRIGVLKLPKPPAREPYVALLESIVHQQLAGAAARAIWGRVISLFEAGVLCPKRLVEMSDELRPRAIAEQGFMRKSPGNAEDSELRPHQARADIYAQFTEIRVWAPGPIC